MFLSARRNWNTRLFALFTTLCLVSCVRAEEGVPEMAVLKPSVRTGFANAGWAYDRYKDMETLDAGKRMTVADLKGPGIIRCIHTTRHRPHELLARGIVLEIYFDDAKEPAVMCPLADFFGDGCNGKSMYFSAKLIECAPWSYNCYIPMPFKSRAKVILRNDTDRNVMNYSFVEWETLPEWKENMGYFHATYRRDSFQLTPKTDHMFFEVEGSGQILGRQFSVLTDEPRFRDFNTVMEGNNEIDIDGEARRIDYLGTEDSFTFSWGFNAKFAGLHAGMPYIEKTKYPLELSMYRFHDTMPIRFGKSLRWHINWSCEKGFTKDPAWAETVNKDGCWVDYAAVHYWYMNKPAGYKHKSLRPVSERMKQFLRHAETETKGSK